MTRRKRLRVLQRDLAGAHAAIDAHLAVLSRASAVQGKPFRCGRAGCNGCCRGEVAVLPLEAVVMEARLDEATWGRVEALRDVDMKPADGPHPVCPLLDPITGVCTVYEVRPATCRAMNAVTDPDLCFPERVGDAIVGRCTDGRVEAWLANQGVGGLVDLLLEFRSPDRGWSPDPPTRPPADLSSLHRPS